MPAGIKENDNMFSVRETPWHGMGVVLDKAPKNSQDALEKSGLNWDVKQVPVEYEWDGNRLTMPTQLVNIREDTGEALGTVSDRYRVLQNTEAFSFLSNLIGSEMHFETAGSLANGKRVWVLAKLPDHVSVGGDRVDVFVFITNSHDGYRAVKAAVSPVRIVCQNTLTWALQSAIRTFAIAHLGDPQGRLEEARKTLEISIDYSKQFKTLGDRLASKKISEAKLNKVLLDLYPVDDNMTARKRDNRIDARNHIVWLWKEGPTRGNAEGSAWSAANAISEFIDYGTATDHDGKLVRAMDDPSGAKNRAFHLVAEQVEVKV